MVMLGHSRESGNLKKMDARFCGHDSLFSEAKMYLVGGVNSPVRAFKAVGGEPIFIKSAKGSRLFSEDGREFIDYCMSFGALILGHAHEDVIKAIKIAAENGTSFGAPTRAETELAKIITSALPSIEKIRFTNSGTEAVIGAVRLARAYTKRDKVIKFKEGYHGHADYLLDCPGVPEDFKKHTLISPYNDLEKTAELAGEHKDIAAIIVEPVAANSGLLLPREGFLKVLRDIADRYGIVLIFDEIITGFRLSYGGAQKLFNIKPDLTCLGKIIGGGLPAGAFGGKEEIMKLLAPEGPVYQAGTFSGNPLTMSAGLAELRKLFEQDPYGGLEKLTSRLSGGIQELAEEYKIKMKPNFIGSMFSVSCDGSLFKKFYYGLLGEGVYFSPSAFETNFISTAHTAEDIRYTLKAVDKVMKNLRGV